MSFNPPECMQGIVQHKETSEPLHVQVMGPMLSVHNVLNFTSVDMEHVVGCFICQKHKVYFKI